MVVRSHGGKLEGYCNWQAVRSKVKGHVGVNKSLNTDLPLQDNLLVVRSHHGGKLEGYSLSLTSPEKNIAIRLYVMINDYRTPKHKQDFLMMDEKLK